MKELEKASDYFPYIGHDLDPEFITRSSYYRQIIGDTFAGESIRQIDPDTLILESSAAPSMFRSLKVKGIVEQRAIAQDPSAVELLVPRHRSLFDYCVGQPVHNNLINPNVLILAGNNLFVSKFDWLLRKYGAIVFLREDVLLKRKNLPPAYLTQKRYIDEVFPAYMKEQMFEGNGETKAKMDLIIYAEQEKDPVTKKRSGGRTKTGKLRSLSHIFFDKLKSLTRESKTRLYVTPVNISFSKYPEAPYIVHPSGSKGFMKVVRYLLEQYFTFVGYPRFTHTHLDAKVEVTVHYGEPGILHADNFNSTRDLLRFSHTLKEKIGLLETVYPLTLLYRAMESDSDVSLAVLADRAKKLYDRYVQRGIDVDNVSDGRGNLLDFGEIAQTAVTAVNCNPLFFIAGVRENGFLAIESGRVVSRDARLAEWYSNHLRHLDHECVPQDDE